MIILGIVAININNGLENFLIKPQGDDKRMDVIGSILGTSVAIASALVAIFLSRIALQFAENENKRGFKEIIEKRGLFNYEFVNKMIYEFNNNIKDRSLNIWALIVLEEWFRQYID